MITTHYMDEAEQLCDRLVVMDKGVIVAEGSPLELIRAALHPRGRRAPVRPVGEPRRAGREGRRPRRAGRGAARPAAGLQRRRRGGRSPRSTSAASARSRRSYAAPRWRTSSSASPAGRWWTDGRSSAPTAPGRLGARPSTACVRGRLDYWMTVYSRTWKGSVISSFVVAAALRAGDGRAARRLRPGATPASSTARRPTSRSSSPAWSPPRRCRPPSARRPTR